MSDGTPAFFGRLAAHAGLELVRLDPAAAEAPGHADVSPLAAQLLGEATCRAHGVLPVAYADGIVVVACATPAGEALDEVAARLRGRDVRFVVAPWSELEAATDRVFGPGPGTPAGSTPPAAAPAVTEPRYPTRVGDLLVARGHASDAQVATALDAQRGTGARLGEVLVAGGVVTEGALVEVLAEHLHLPLVDLDAFEPDPRALAALPPGLMSQLRCVPIAADESTLYLAVADALDEGTVAALREHTSLDLRGFLASRSSVDALLARLDPTPEPEPEPEPGVEVEGEAGRPPGPLVAEDPHVGWIVPTALLVVLLVVVALVAAGVL